MSFDTSGLEQTNQNLTSTQSFKANIVGYLGWDKVFIKLWVPPMAAPVVKIKSHSVYINLCIGYVYMFSWCACILENLFEFSAFVMMIYKTTPSLG